MRKDDTLTLLCWLQLFCRSVYSTRMMKNVEQLPQNTSISVT